MSQELGASTGSSTSGFDNLHSTCQVLCNTTFYVTLQSYFDSIYHVMLSVARMTNNALQWLTTHYCVMYHVERADVDLRQHVNKPKVIDEAGSQACLSKWHDLTRKYERRETTGQCCARVNS